MNISMLIAFIIYFVTVLCVAFFGYRYTMRKARIKKGDSSGFLVGDRSLNYWVTALSAQASDMSSWIFMAFPAAIFIQGLYATWIAIGLLIFMFLNWHFIAPKLRVITEKYNVTTISSFFEKRFNDKSGVIRIVSALMTLVFFTIYISAGLKGIAIVLESAFGFKYEFGVLAAVFIVFLYTSVGGFIGVAWTDLFQGIFLLIMIILVPIVAGHYLGGISTIYSSLVRQGFSFSLVPDMSLKAIFGGLILAFGWGLGYFGMPHILTKFMAIKDVKDMSKSKYVGMVWQLAAFKAAIVVGMIGVVFFRTGIANSEHIFIEMVKYLFHPFFAGLVLCAILAAIVSTIDSQILVLAAVLTDDFYKKIVNKDAKRRELYWVFLVGITFVCAISSFLALNKGETIMSLVMFAWIGLGCSFGALVVLSLYSRVINKYGAIFGILVGGISSILWRVVFGFPEAHGMVFGFVLSGVTIYLVSYLTGGNKEPLAKRS